MTDLVVYPADKEALEKGWQKLTDIPVDFLERIVQPFECMGRFFPSGTDRFEIWTWFDSMGFYAGNRMNGINPFFRSGVDPNGFNEKTADAIVIQGATRTYVWLYVKGLDALAITVKCETIKVDFMNYDKCLSALKVMVDKKIPSVIQPWLLDAVRQLQTSEAKDPAICE